MWEHALGQPLPARTVHCDASLDEVVLRGSLNVPLALRTTARPCSPRRCGCCKPGGWLLVRILSGDKEHPTPALTGSGAAVRFVPAKDDVMGLLAARGLTGLRLLKYDDPPCFVADGVTMRATHIEAFRA